MAEIIQSEAVVALSRREITALAELLDTQEDLSPALVDLNNQLQTI